MEALESEVTVDLSNADKAPCSACKNRNLPAAVCTDCDEAYHLHCVPKHRQWHIWDARFRCGCQEATSRAVSQTFLPRKRGRPKQHLSAIQGLVQNWDRFLNLAETEPFVTGEWVQRALPKREYEPLTTYYAADLRIKRRLRTRYEGKCKGTGCGNLEDLGPLDYSLDTWASSNSDRARKLECTSKCKCQPGTCKNRQISLKAGPVLGTDVTECPTWGFDRRTATLLNLILRFVRPKVSSLDFIEGPLQRAINQNNSPDLRRALKFLARKGARNEAFLANYLLEFLQKLEEVRPETVTTYFRLHPKGTGVVCRNSKGIEANSFIVEYLGELYTPAQWFEKQDVIKRYYAKLSKSKHKLPDFYNIFLERHTGDTLGYDLLMVDPVCKASFGSRLSHSCHPNCGTVTMVAGGEYTVAMYALRDIKPGEELTFDYVSYTENKDEAAEAVCLCGSRHCRGTYLAFEKATNQPPRNHSTAHRLWTLVHSVTDQEPRPQRTTSDTLSVKRALLFDSPHWLKWWVHRVCSVILADSADLRKPEQKERRNFWVRNLAITIDKVKYCLHRHHLLHNYMHPPVTRLNKKQTLALLNSVLNDLAILCPEIQSRPSKSLLQARLKLLEFRDSLRSHAPKNPFIADLVHLVAYTQYFFQDWSFAKFSAEPAIVRECEVYKTVSNQEITQDFSKTYEPKYIHGTMLNWFKHTVEKPDSTYSALKRAVSGIPDFKLLNRKDTRSYDQNQFSKHLRKHHEFPPRQVKMLKTAFGSPMLDYHFSPSDDWLGTCLKDLNKSKSQCKKALETILRRTRSSNRIQHKTIKQ